MIIIGLLAWAVATTLAVAILLLKKWLKKKCENCVREDDDVPTSPPPQSIDDDHSSSSTSPDPDLSTIHPSTPTTIHNDDDDDGGGWTWQKFDRRWHQPASKNQYPSVPQWKPKTSYHSPILRHHLPRCWGRRKRVARNTRSKRQLKF